MGIIPGKQSIPISTFNNTLSQINSEIPNQENQENQDFLNNQVNSLQQDSIIQSYKLKKKDKQTIHSYISKLMELSAWGIEIADTYFLASNMLKSRNELTSYINNFTPKNSASKFSELKKDKTFQSLLLRFGLNNGLRAYFGSGGFVLGMLFLDNRVIGKMMANFQNNFYKTFSKSKAAGIKYLLKIQASLIATTSLTSYFFGNVGDKAISWAFLMPFFVTSAVLERNMIDSILKYAFLENEMPFLEIEFNNEKILIENPNFQGKKVKQGSVLKLSDLSTQDQEIIKTILQNGNYAPVGSANGAVDNHYGIKSLIFRSGAIIATSAIGLGSLCLARFALSDNTEIKTVFSEFATLLSTYSTFNLIKVFPDKLSGKLLNSQNKKKFYSSNLAIGSLALASSIGLYGSYGVMNIKELTSLALPDFFQSGFGKALYDLTICNFVLGSAVFFECYAFDSIIRVMSRLTDESGLSSYLDQFLDKMLSFGCCQNDETLRQRKIIFLSTLVMILFAAEIACFGNPAITIPLRITRSCVFAAMCRYSALEKNDQQNLQEILLQNLNEIELYDIIIPEENQNNEQENLNNFKDKQRLEIENGERYSNGKKMSRKNQKKFASDFRINYNDKDNKIYQNQVNIGSIGQLAYTGSNKTETRNF